MLLKLKEPQKELCEYLGVEMIQVVCEDIEEDSRYYFKDDFIIISPQMLESYTDALKSLVHEIRHQYQYKCANDPNTKENPILVNDWRHEFSNLKRPVDPSNQESVNEYFSMMTDLDAAAFSKWYLEWKVDGQVFSHPNGSRITTATFNKWFKKVRDKAGIPENLLYII